MNWTRGYCYKVMAVSALVFLGIIFLFAYTEFMVKYDNHVVNLVSVLKNSFVDNFLDFFPSITALVLLAVISILVLGLCMYTRRYWDALFYVVLVGSGSLIQLGLKEVFHRVRPENILETGFSFPSTHVTLAVLVFGAVDFIFWRRSSKASFVFIFAPIIVALIRLYLGVHWFSDVLASFAFGFFWVAFCIIIYSAIFYIKERDAD